MTLPTETVRSGAELAPSDVSAAAAALLDESVEASAKADFLAALSSRGESPAEIAAFADEFLHRAVDPGLDSATIDAPLLDVCGTGGDKLGTFNVSTTTVFVLAACGVAVVKHGNRGITSKSGGADVLEALGIRIDLPPGDFCRCVEEVGAGFLFAPLYHPAFKAVAPVRKLLAERGQRTMFNILGPLLNPVRPPYQVVGIFDGSLGPAYTAILAKLGRAHAWTVHGTTETGAGMDELSNLGPSQVWETRDGRNAHFSIEPGSLGLAAATTRDIEGGDATENAALLRGILAGDITGPPRDIVLLNAAAGLLVTGKTDSLETGIEEAGKAIDSGAAIAVLEQWRDFA